MPLAVFLGVTFLIFLVAGPFVALAALIRSNRQRQLLEEFKLENAKRLAGLQREVWELKQHVATLAPGPVGSVVGQAVVSGQPVQPATQAVPPVPVVAPTVVPQEPLRPVTTVSPVLPAKHPEIVPEKLPVVPATILSAPIHAIPPSAAASAPPPAKPAEIKIELPAAAKSPAEIRTVPPEFTAPKPVEPKPPVARPAAPPPPFVPPHVPVAIPPLQASGVRISQPSTISPLRVPAPKATFQQRMKTVSALEETLGTNWLGKLGIIMTVIGISLLGILELGTLGAAGKVAISYFVAIVLLAGGIFLEKRERYQLLGRAGIGGGWALLFFSTYGISHVEAMRVLPIGAGWLSIDCALMLAVAGGMALHTLRYRSQFVTGLAFLLGYATVALSNTAMNPDTVYSLSAGVILAIGLVAIVQKMGWFELEIFGILSGYLNHLYWLYRILGPDGAHGRAFPEYHASLALLFFFWITFRVSYVIRGVKSIAEERLSTVAAVLNTLLLLGCMKFQSVQPDLAYIALLAIGAAEFAVAQLPITKRRREAFTILSVMGALLMIVAVPSHYTGNNVAILWLVGAEIFLAAGVIVKEVLFRRLGLLTGILVGCHLVGFDFRTLLDLKAHGESVEIASGVLFVLCAVIFYVNVFFVGARWEPYFEDRPDKSFLLAHSYIGAIAAGAGAWSLFVQDWTALAFAAVMLVLALLGRKFQTIHVQVQYALFGLLTFFRAVSVNLHFDGPSHVHLTMRLLTLPILGAAFYLAAKLAALRDDQEQRVLRGIFAFGGTALLGLLIWFEVPELWQPLAFIAFGVALSEAGRALRYYPVVWHAHLASLAAAFVVLMQTQWHGQAWHSLPLNVLSALPVVIGYYWLAKRSITSNERHLELARIAYTWAAAALTCWCIEETYPDPWIAVGWIAFAVALIISTRWVRYAQLFWQANVVGVLALVRAFLFNYAIERQVWPGVSARILTVSLVAAGLYFLSRRGAPEERYARAVAFLHSFAATGLLALLAWYEEPNGWLAPLWALFALVLAIVDRYFECEELPWQSHILALLTLARCLTVNIYVTETWHDVDIRLISMAIVVVIFYALSRIVRMPKEWREHDFHHAYSWAASSLAGLLLWYELATLSKAVGWAVFGLVLFEYGLLRKIRQFRYQAYVAMFAAFTRIFFANLTADDAGEFWGPRMYTIVPLALILFFMYAQLPSEEESTERDRQFHFDWLLAYLGTATVVALFYFQFAPEWVVTALAGLVFVLFAMALLLDRAIFLHQGMLLTVGVFIRGMSHNLFGAGYFNGGTWSGRYAVLGSAIAILLASIFLAFRLRKQFEIPSDAGRLVRRLATVARRPEQLQFFVAIVLLTFMLAMRTSIGMITIYWGIEGVCIFLLGLAVKERSYRLTGVGVLLLCIAKTFAMDIWRLDRLHAYLTVAIVGIVATAVSFLYSRYRETVRQLL